VEFLFNGMKNIIIVGTYPSTEYNEKMLDECISALTNKGYDIMIVSHYPAPQYIQEKVQFYIFDTDNTLDPAELSPTVWMYNQSFDLHLKGNARVNVIVKNMLNGINFAKYLGYKSFIYMESDNILVSEDFDKLNGVVNNLITEEKEMFFFLHQVESNVIYESLIFGGTPDFFINKISLPVVNNYLLDYGGEITLETIFYYIFRGEEDRYITINEPSNIYLGNSVINKNSSSFFCDVVKDSDNERYVLWIWNHESNTNDVTVQVNGQYSLTIHRGHWYFDILIEDIQYTLTIQDGENSYTKQFIVNETTKEKIRQMGYIRFKS
jgi:hypothetical protein